MRDILDEDLKIPTAPNLQNATEILKLRNTYNELHKKVKHGRVALWVLLGYTILGAIMELAEYGADPFILGINGAVILIYLACVIVAIKKPFYGLLSAAIVFTLILVMLIVVDPTNIIAGLLIKAIIIIYLVGGVMAARDYIGTLKQLKSFGIVVEGSEILD